MVIRAAFMLCYLIYIYLTICYLDFLILSFPLTLTLVSTGKQASASTASEEWRGWGCGTGTQPGETIFFGSGLFGILFLNVVKSANPSDSLTFGERM